MTTWRTRGAADEAPADPVRANRREALERSLTGRFWLRFHATLIVAGTFGTAFLTSFLLLRAGLDAVLPRWLLAVAVGYGAFFVLVRFWLAYTGIRGLVPTGDGGKASSSTSGGGVDLRLPEGPWKGAGGRFGGAGATADFASPGAVPLADLGASGVSSGAAEEASGAFANGVDVDDAAPLVLGLIVLALVALALGSAIAFIWMAPDLLSDAAFAALLSSGALPGLARADSSDWHGTLFAATWQPLLGIVVVVIVAAFALWNWFPHARTLGEAWRMLG